MDCCKVVEPGTKVRLSKIEASYTGKHETHEKALPEIQAQVERMGKLQYLLYADGRKSLLGVLQALDAAGKDGVICHLFGGMNRKAARSNQTTRAAWCRSGAVALVVALLAGCDEAQNKFVAPPPPTVGVSVPLQKAVTPYLEFTGTTAAYASVNLVARVEGYLKAIKYVDGATAKAGELVFEIDPAPYEAQVKQNEADVAGARAALVQAEDEFQRQSTLFKEDVNSAAFLDKARAARDTDKANVDAQEASLQTAQINLSYTRIEAPFDGIVTRHLASVGELVGIGGNTTLASLVQLDPIYVMFNVSDQDLARFRASHADRRLTLAELQTIPIEVGLTNEDGFPHKGKADYVSPTLDPQTATILVRGAFANKDRVLLPGMFARVRVPMGPPVADALLIPDRILAAEPARPLRARGRRQRRSRAAHGAAWRARWQLARDHGGAQAGRQSRCQRGGSRDPRPQGRAAAFFNRVYGR
jgi:RND family efflux transporter MFP subunit